jgi:hypothetical protein
MDWAVFQACLDDRLPGNPVVNDEEAIEKCVEELTSSIQEAAVASVLKHLHRADPRPPLQVPGGLALSDSEKAEALADSLEAQLQPVNDTSDPAVIEMVNEAMRAYEYEPASEPKLTSTSEVLQTIRGLKVGKAPGPNSIPNRVLTHLPKHAITFLTKCLTQSSSVSTSHQHGNTLAWFL